MLKLADIVYQSLGEEYVSEDYTEYEICTKCDTIIRFSYSSQGGSRYDIEDGEEKIIRKQIKQGRLKCKK